MYVMIYTQEAQHINHAVLEAATLYEVIISNHTDVKVLQFSLISELFTHLTTALFTNLSL